MFFKANPPFFFLSRDNVTVLVEFNIGRVFGIEFGVKDFAFDVLNQIGERFQSVRVVFDEFAEVEEHVQFLAAFVNVLLLWRHVGIKPVEKFIGRQDFSERETVESGNDFVVEFYGEVFTVEVDLPTVGRGGVHGVESVDKGKHFVRRDNFVSDGRLVVDVDEFIFIAAGKVEVVKDGVPIINVKDFVVGDIVAPVGNIFERVLYSGVSFILGDDVPVDFDFAIFDSDNDVFSADNVIGTVLPDEYVIG